MSKRPSSPAAESAEETVQVVRQELIKSQLVVLELQDLLLEIETDKADAIALLGQAELVLEEKIAHILELDRVLNVKITELSAKNASLTVERNEVRQTLVATQHANEATIRDLVERLDKANQDAGQAHELAKSYADLVAAAESKLHDQTQDLLHAREKIDTLTATGEQLAGDLASVRDESTELGRGFAEAQRQLAESKARETALLQRLGHIQASWLWRSTRLLRRLFGPEQ